MHFKQEGNPLQMSSNNKNERKREPSELSKLSAKLAELGAQQHGDDVLALFTSSADMAKAMRRNDVRGETEAVVCMSELALRFGIVPLAHAYALDALGMCRHYQMFGLECHILCVLTRIALASNRVKEALAYLQEARDFLSVTDDARDAFEFHKTSGEVWMLLGDHISAQSHFEKAWHLLSNEDWAERVSLLGLLVLVYALTGDMSSAVNYGVQALECASTPGERTPILVALASARSRRGDYERAAEYYQRAFDSWSECESREKYRDAIALAVQHIRQTSELARRIRIPAWVPALLAERPKLNQLPTIQEIADRLADTNALHELFGALLDKESVAYLNLLASDMRLPDGSADETLVIQLLSEAIEMVGSALVDLDDKDDANSEYQSPLRASI